MRAVSQEAKPAYEFVELPECPKQSACWSGEKLRRWTKIQFWICGKMRQQRWVVPDVSI